MTTDELKEVHSESRQGHFNKQTKIQQILTDSASFGMRLRGSISKAVVNTKVSAMHRFANAEYTLEEPDMVAALETLKATKNHINLFVKTARKFYRSLQSTTEYQKEYGAMLRTVGREPNDGFKKFASAMGDVEHNLQVEKQTIPDAFREKVLDPLENFLQHDIQKCQTLKLEYKQIKAQYDLAVHAHAKLISKDSRSDKLSQTSSKKTETEYSLKAARDTLQDAIKRLEKKKNKEILEHIEEFWNSYEAVHRTSAKIISEANLKADFTQDALRATVSIDNVDNVHSLENNEERDDSFGPMKDTQSPVSAVKSDAELPHEPR